MTIGLAHTARGRLLRELDAEREALQPPRHGNANWLAIIKIAEWEEIRDHLGACGCSAVLQSLSHFIAASIPKSDRILQTYKGEISVVVRNKSEAQLEKLLASLSRKVVRHRFVAGGEPIHVTPAIGFAAFTQDISSGSGLQCAQTALAHSLAHLDLKPTPFSYLLQQPSRWQQGVHALGVPRGLRFAFHVVLALVLALGVPLAIYLTLPSAIANTLATVVFIITILVLVTTATVINVEGVLSLRSEQPPDQPLQPYPKASAIIAAYLPNEAASVVATVDSLLSVDYPAQLQVVLAYNTPHDLPVEDLLRSIAKRDPRFILLRVPESTSKAQNINAALALIDGEFTAIFDADHRPLPNSFKRAWHWLSDGADVVQGHCVVRNGTATLLSRIVAVEFEQIYAVAHPGGMRLRRYGIFGGSNGYWRTNILREIRMRSAMLTEDIDSSMRVVCDGRRIVSDPGLISTELAPATLRSLAHQRLRWNQGWFQVSLRHLRPLLRSRNLTLRQKIGSFHLLAWREMFPWFSLQVFPVLIYWVFQAGSIYALDWQVPILLATTAYVLSTGPLQTLIAYANAAPLIRRRAGWFLLHMLFINFYSEFLTHLTRVAHLRQLFGEREWRITARSLEDTSPRSAIVDPFHEGDMPPAEEVDRKRYHVQRTRLQTS